jgi:hypothetical protein
MARIDKFVYHQKNREVIVMVDGNGSIRGIDLSIMDEDTRKLALKVAETVDFEGKVDEAQMVEAQKLKDFMKYFRHFKKDSIEQVKQQDE